MAKVTGPLFSLDAKKTIKKLLTFQKRPSGHSISPYKKPGGRAPFSPSAKQTAQRSAIGALVAAWQALNDGTKALWEAAAKSAGYIGAGYHYFIHTGGVGVVALGPYLLLEDSDKMLLEIGDGIVLDEPDG